MCSNFLYFFQKILFNFYMKLEFLSYTTYILICILILFLDFYNENEMKVDILVVSVLNFSGQIIFTIFLTVAIFIAKSSDNVYTIDLFLIGFSSVSLLFLNELDGKNEQNLILVEEILIVASLLNLIFSLLIQITNFIYERREAKNRSHIYLEENSFNYCINR